MNYLFKVRQDFNREVKKIPRQNRLKFQADLYKLVQLAQLEDYDNFKIAES